MAVIQLQPVILAFALVLGAWLVKFINEGYHWRKRFRDKSLALPCPPHHWLFGHLPVVVKLFQKIPQDCHPHVHVAVIGPQYKLPKFYYMDNWPFGPPSLIITDPEIAQQITVLGSYDKHPELMKYTKPLSGSNNLVSVNGETWKKWRRIFNPGFAVGHLMGMVPEIVEDTEAFVKALGKFADSGAVFRLEDVATRFTVDVIGRVTMDVQFHAQETDHPLINAFRSQVRWLPRIQNPNPLYSLHPIRFFIMRRNIKTMRGFLETELEKRLSTFDFTLELKGPEYKKKKSVVDLALREYLKEARAEGRVITKLDEEFKENAITQALIFIFAGHDTTSSTICYIYHLLSRHPEALAKIRAEHNEVLGPDPSAAADIIRNDPHIINKLHYTLAVIKETLRLWPPASSVRSGAPGLNITDPETGKTYPTEGFLVWPAVFGIHRSANNWSRPSEFIPERFMPDPPEELVPLPNAWRPFEKGTRNCIGQELALIESRIAVAMTIRTFEFEVQYDNEGWRDEVVGFDGKPEVPGTSEEGFRPQQGKIDNFMGDKAYQVLLGTAKPKEGMPSVVRRVKA